MSKETIHFPSQNRGEIDGGDERDGYRSHISHSSSHNPVDYGILLIMTGSYCNVDDIIYENEIGDSRGDDARCGIRSQEIIHSSFQNDGEGVDGDGISGFRSNTIPSP